MAQRRDRPPVVRSGDSLNIRLPDGRTMSMPVSTPREQDTSDICCFCGRTVEHADPDRVRIGVRWGPDGSELEQSWAAHRGCLLERLDEEVKGHGPFFGD